MTPQVSGKKRVQPIEFLWLGLYAFAGFALELLLGAAVNVLGTGPLSRGVHLVITGLLWFLAAFLLIWLSKTKFDYNVLAVQQKLTAQQLPMVLLLIGAITIATWVGFGGFKPLVEFQSGSGGDITRYLLQVFYYLGESSLIVLTIAFGQHFCEKQFSVSNNLPYGGLFLAATWGLMHFFLQGVSGGVFTLFFSVLAGVIYVLCGRDFRWSYLFVAIAFVL